MVLVKDLTRALAESEEAALNLLFEGELSNTSNVNFDSVAWNRGDEPLNC